MVRVINAAVQPLSLVNFSFVLIPPLSSGEQFSRNERTMRISRQLSALPFFKISDMISLFRIGAHVKTTKFLFCLFCDTTIRSCLIVPSYVTSHAKISDLINENVHCSKRYWCTFFVLELRTTRPVVHSNTYRRIANSKTESFTLPQELVIYLKCFNYISD